MVDERRLLAILTRLTLDAYDLALTQAQYVDIAVVDWNVTRGRTTRAARPKAGECYEERGSYEKLLRLLHLSPSGETLICFPR